MTNFSYLLPEKGRGSKQKTNVARRTCNPAWNHTFIYEDVSLQELSERSLELTVWDHDRLASNEFLGGLRFNLGSGKENFLLSQVIFIEILIDYYGLHF
jgi:synaptotagmin-like protein